MDGSIEHVCERARDEGSPFQFGTGRGESPRVCRPYGVGHFAHAGLLRLRAPPPFYFRPERVSNVDAVQTTVLLALGAKRGVT